MAKNSIRDYSATNSSNTDIQSIDISEGCSPAGINNAIREVMADLKDVSTGAVALESPAFDSASLTGDLTLGDNDKAVFGAGSDLEIYHNGTKSIISDVGTGVLRLAGTDFDIMNSSQTKRYMLATDGGAVSLYYDNSVKLATTATGVDVSSTDATVNFVSSRGTGATHTITTGGANSGNFNINAASGGDIYVNAENKIFRNAAGSNEHMRIDSSGNVGIGTSSPDASHKLEVASSGTAEAGIRSGNTSEAILNFGRTSDRLRGRIAYNNSSEYMAFWANQGEKMRIDSSGNLRFANTAMNIDNSSNTATGVSLANSGLTHVATQSGTTGILVQKLNPSGSETMLFFLYGASGVGSIRTTSVATQFNTNSDYRLKENVVADWDATTRLKQLNPVRFNFIADADTTVDGFLAHEVQDVVPESISGTKDAMMDEEYQVSAATGDIYTPAIEATFDDDGNEVTPAVAEVIHSTDVEQPEELEEGQQWRETTAAVMGTRSVPDYQGIDQSKLVPLLVKTIQELEARITALEAN